MNMKDRDLYCPILQGTLGETFGEFEDCADCLICETCRRMHKEYPVEDSFDDEILHHINENMHICTTIKTPDLIILDAYNGGGIIIKQKHKCTGCGKHEWHTVQRMDEFDFVTKVQ